MFFSHLYVKTEKAQQREKNLEEAKKITIKEDESLPKAKRVSIQFTKNTGYKKLASSDRQFSKSLLIESVLLNVKVKINTCMSSTKWKVEVVQYF